MARQVKPRRTRYLLIDADTFIYKAAVVCQTKIEWDPGLFTLDADLNKAKEAFHAMVTGLADEAGEYLEIGDTLVPVICLTDLTNQYRKELDPTYKNQRSERPFIFSEVRAWVEGNYPAWSAGTTELSVCMRPRLEADDILGILGTLPGAVERQDILFSEDKDLWQIPGLHMTKNGLEDVTPEAADRFFYTQVLTGDQVDNYPGCPGVGPVTASKLLDAAEGGNYWPIIVSTYEKKGLTEEYAILQARLARILRASEFNFKTKEPILWTPPRSPAS